MIFGIFVLVVVCLVGLLVARLRNAPAGRMFIAVRSNERAASAVGIDVARTKLLAFGLSAFIAGLGGGLYAYAQQTVTAPSFAVFTSLSLLAITYVAGVGRIAGAVVAGVMLSSTGLLVTALDKAFNIGKYQLVVAGVLLTLTAIKQPDGIAASPPPPLVKLGNWLAAKLSWSRRTGHEARGRALVTALDHAGLSVADLDAARGFYERAFGFAPSSRSSCRAASAAPCCGWRAAGGSSSSSARSRSGADAGLARSRRWRPAATGTSRSARRTSTRCSRARGERARPRR